MMDYVNASQLMGLGCFLILDANHTIANSKFFNFYSLIWFYQISNIYIMKWVNSEFSGGGVQMFIYSERYDLGNFSVAIIERCRFTHIFTFGQFTFKWLTTSVYYWNSYFENMTLQMQARSWFKGEEGDLFIENTTFVNCGFINESSQLIKIFDKSLFNVWVGYKNDIRNSIFLIDDSCSMRGGFINIFNSYTSFILINSTFKVTKHNPNYSYKGVIVLNAPINLVKDSYFINLRCASIDANIEQENGAGLLILGTLSYVPTATGIKV
jgi:hypothetical protein